MQGITKRQKEILQLVLEGKDTSEIAKSIGISLDGVKYHLKKTMKKLNKTNRYLAAIEALEKGLLNDN